MTEEHTSEAVREAVARQLAARQMGLLKDTTGARLDVDLWGQCLGEADAAIAAHLAALSAMGRVVVPQVATDAMLEEGLSYLPSSPGGVKLTKAGQVWEAMLAASPMEAPPHER